MSDYHEYQGVTCTLEASMTPAKKTRAAKPTAVEKAQKASRTRSAAIKQNGVSRPSSGTAGGKVWDIADALSEQTSEPAIRKDVLKAAELEGLNLGMTAAQYSVWRRYNGLTGTSSPGRKSEPNPKHAKTEPFMPEEVME